MEVLHGNQPGAGHDRRARDRATDGRRALDWSTRPSDILLFPHSPLALADVLAHPIGRLDLLPVPPASSAAARELARENELAGEDSLTPVVSLHQRRRQRHPRERVNLLTRHGEEELLERCRALLIESALVKEPGLRQLFLAAGFLSWEDGDEPGRRRRAPLLLYPVLLARTANEHGYELRLDGSHPLGNESLREIINERHGILLPLPDAEQPLADHLALVASLLADNDALSLDFDIALGNADMPRPTPARERVHLPPPPPGFDKILAAQLTGTLSLGELQGVLHLLPDDDVLAAEPGCPRTLDADDDDRADHDDTDEGAVGEDTMTSASARTGLTRLREYAARLAAEGLDRIEFRHIDALPRRLERWCERVREALGTSTVTTLIGNGGIGGIGARHLVRLAGIIELVDKAPVAIDHYAHPDLCFRSTTTLLRRARHQARLIEDELAALQDWFVLDKVPAKRQLLSMIEELGSTLGNEPDIVDADYFSARRQFMEFSIEKPPNLTPEHRHALGQLAKVMRFRELFVNNVEYRAALGPGYRGLRTDWEALESMSDYALELAEVLESETLAAAAIGAWPTFRRAFVIELETLQNAADATRRLLRVTGSRWQSRPTEELLEQASVVGERIAHWHEQYGGVRSHGSRTPAALLARFSGREREDLLTEARVVEAQAHIERGIAERSLDREQVIVTLAWLREASEVADTHSLGIEAITAHLALT